MASSPVYFLSTRQTAVCRVHMSSRDKSWSDEQKWAGGPIQLFAHVCTE